jgi:hypothetical protein
MMCFLQKTNIMSIHLIDTDQDSMTKLIEFMELHQIKFDPHYALEKRYEG